MAIMVAVAGCGSSSLGVDGSADGASRDDANQTVDAVADVARPDGAGNDGGADAIRDASDAADRSGSPDVTDAAAADASGATDAPGPSDGTLNARYVFKMPLLGERLIGDPLRRRFYVSIAGASPQYPNSLLAIDANDGAIVANTFVGSNPRSLALSDDSSTLWVGIDGALSIRRVMLTTDPPGIGPLTPLSPLLGIGQTLGPMVPVAGAPLSVVASTPDGRKTAVLDDGVARAGVPTSLGRSASSMAAGAAGYVYGYDGQDTAFGFLTMAVSASGIADVSTTSGLMSGFGNQIISQGNHVYAATGEVIDISTPTHPVAGGRLPGVGPMAPGPPNRIFVITGDTPDAATSAPTQILAIDGTTLKVVGSIPLPPDLYGTGSDFTTTSNPVYVGPDALGLLIRRGNLGTNDQTGTLVIIRDPLIATIK